ncbi:MAG TPA: MMPL family transporter, partial [Candidatus Saccharimonadia bacterium]|nr:MMPL family transporter [Candidatus Saccharimonadia bacterium]
TGERTTQSTGKAVVLATLTTIAGFGSLMVARHAGIFSFGLLLALSVTCNLVAVFTVLPLLLRVVRLKTVAPNAVDITPTMRAD